MSLEIDATVGGASANSFVSHAEFSAYMEGRLNATAFTGSQPETIRKALVEATRELSPRPWPGYRVTGTQALSWPRQWAHNPDSPVQDYYATTVIPDRIKRATYELALAFLKAGTTDVASLDTDLQIQSREVGGAIRTEFVEPYARVRGLSRYPAVMREIEPIIGRKRLGVRAVRG